MLRPAAAVFLAASVSERGPRPRGSETSVLEVSSSLSGRFLPRFLEVSSSLSGEPRGIFAPSSLGPRRGSKMFGGALPQPDLTRFLVAVEPRAGAAATRTPDPPCSG